MMSDHQKKMQELVPLLKRYCHAIASSPWEAEDLMQETMLRWHASTIKNKEKEKQTTISKAFIYKMAVHTWIDQLRKKRLIEQPLDTVKKELPSSFQPADRFDIEHVLDRLVRLVPLRQSIVLLLHDIFDFRAKEIALFLATSEGAIKACLHRARSTLQTASSQADISKDQQTENDSLTLKPTVEQEKAIQVMTTALVNDKPMLLIPLISEPKEKQTDQPANLYALAA